MSEMGAISMLMIHCTQHKCKGDTCKRQNHVHSLLFIHSDWIHKLHVTIPNTLDTHQFKSYGKLISLRFLFHVNRHRLLSPP